MSAFAKRIFEIMLWFFAIHLSILPAFSQQRVDLNLVLAIDCSYSVDGAEFDLQIHGTAAAFTNFQVIKAITSGKYGKIGVAVIQWSDTDSQIITVPWTIVSSQIDAYKLALAIKSQTRRTAQGSTSISAALDKGAEMLFGSPNIATRMAIDVAADGENNSGERVEYVRDRIVKAGIVINGLSILNEVGYLNYYFQNRVIGGNGAFVQIAKDYNNFGEAIRKKILREIFDGGIS